MEDTIEVKTLSNIKKQICINITPTTVNQKFDEFFNSVKKDALVPGFRKGRAPVSILKKHFKKQALSTIAQMLISEFYQKTLREHNINPASPPNVDNPDNNTYLGSFDSDNSYSVEITIEVLPTIDPVGYDDIELDMSNDRVDEIFEKKILELRNQYAEREQIIDGTAQLGDSVVMDYKGYIDNKPFPAGSYTGFFVDSLGAPTLVSDFEEQLVGIKVGETRRVKVKFPESYKVKELINKEAEFDVTIQNIVRKHLAKIDEDLAMIAGYENVNELKNKIREEAKQTDSQDQRQKTESIITSILIEKNDFEVPASLLNEEKNRIKSQEQNIRGSLDECALRNVKRAILFDAIYDKEDDIEIDPSEMNEFLEEQAKLYNYGKEDFVSKLYNDNQMDTFIGVLRAKKVVDFIISKNQKDEEAHATE